MDTIHGRHRLLWVTTAFVLVGSTPGHTQTLPLRVIAPAQQAERDAVRLHILEAELAAELAALASARHRRAERWHAADRVGAVEAQAAIDTHGHNITALRRELQFLARPPNSLPSVAASRDLHDAVRVPTSATATASCGGGVGRPSRAQWDMFQLRGMSVDANCTPRDGDHRPRRGVMWVERSTQSDRIKADGTAVERSAANATRSLEGSSVPLMTYREPRFGLPPAFASSDTSKTVEGSRLPPTSAGYPQ